MTYRDALRAFCGALCGTLALAAPLAFTGCEEEVTPIIGTDRAYTLYGALTPEADTQFVRVFPIEEILEPTSPVPLDARVVSTDLETGVQHAWRDSLVMDFRRQYAHVFWSPFRPEHGHTYRIEIEGATGASAVDVTIPLPATIEVQEAISASSTTVPVLIRGDAGNLLGIEIDYTVGSAPGLGSGPITLTVPFEGQMTRQGEGWLLRIDMAREREEIVVRLDARGAYRNEYGVLLLDMRLHMIVANDAWVPPGGVFDPEVLIQPDVMTNVENGFGFVGAGYELSHTWRPPEEMLLRAGYRPFEADSSGDESGKSGIPAGTLPAGLAGMVGR